jgi:L-lactate utilization protein LutB
LAIRVAKGNENRPDEEFSDTNRFNESPRALRVPAIEKLPELLDRLAKKAESTSKKIQAATTQARDVNAILKQTAKELAKPAK